MTNNHPMAIGRVEVADLPLLRAFYCEYFPDKKKLNNDELWRWEYMENPRAKENIPFFVIRHDSAIRGAIGGIPVMLQIGSECVSACHPVDFFVSPEYKGLPALRLFKKIFGEWKVHFASYVSNDAAKLFEAAGFINLSEHLRAYHYILNPISSQTAPRKRARSFVIRKARYLVRRSLALFLNAFGNSGTKTQRHQHLSPAIIPSHETCNRPHRIGILKSPEYLNWRYNDSPTLRCQYFSQTRHGSPNCLIVVNELEGDKHAVILDIIASTENVFDICRILLAMIEYYDSKNFHIISSVNMNEAVDKALRLIGFYYRLSANRLMFYSADKDLREKLRDASKWDFNLGDTDVY
jgi:hypothetical protein